MVFGLRLGLAGRKPSASDTESEQPLVKDPPLPTPGGGGSRERQPGRGPGPGGKNPLTVNEFVAKTKRSREKGLAPTRPELISYAKYLGIDPVVDGDLMWVADEALKAPLPCEWTEHHDSAERIFYYHVDTHESSWTHPLEQLHRDTYKCIVNFRSGELSKEEQLQELERLRRKCEESEQRAHKELQTWTEHTDEQGQKFYFNKVQQRSVWTDPRPARCHSLYLQMKALRVLGQHCGQTVSPRADLDSADDATAEEERSERRAKDDMKTFPRSPTEATQDSGRGAPATNPAAAEPERRRQKGKKSNKAKHGGADGLASSLCLDNAIANEMRKSGTLKDFKKSKLMDLNKPSRVSAEEVRSALGMSVSLPLLGSGSPGGEGLSMVGRTRVRAGIRLEPLPGGV